MDLKKIIPILAIVGVFVYGGIKIRNNMTKIVGAPAPVQVDQSKVKKNLGEYLRQPRANYKPAMEANTQVPKACVDYFDQLQKLDLISFKQSNFKVSYQDLPQPPTDCVMVDDAYQAAEKTFMEKCLMGNNTKSDVVSEDCASSLFMMRAAVTRVIFKDKPIKEISDLHQLTDLLFAEFSGAFNAEHSPDFSRISSVAARMLELNPNLYVAAKVAAITDVIPGLINEKTATPEQKAEYWAKAEQSLKRAQNMNPNDGTLADAEAAVRTEGFNPAKTVEYAQGLVQKNPGDDRAQFLLAMGQWKSNDRNASVQSLQRAIELNPTNQDYQKTMAAISSPDATGDSFKGSISINVSSDDFNP
jgi:tetratricopeptide (TPR) repeat protein